MKGLPRPEEQHVIDGRFEGVEEDHKRANDFILAVMFELHLDFTGGFGSQLIV